MHYYALVEVPEGNDLESAPDEVAKLMLPPDEGFDQFTYKEIQDNYLAGEFWDSFVIGGRMAKHGMDGKGTLIGPRKDLLGIPFSLLTLDGRVSHREIWERTEGFVDTSSRLVTHWNQVRPDATLVVVDYHN